MPSLDWRTAVAVAEDVQDSNIAYKINTRIDEPVAKKLVDYLNWKVNQAPKPFWFVKSGE